MTAIEAIEALRPHFGDRISTAEALRAEHGHDEAHHAPALPADDLTRLRGVGPKLVEQLAELGYYRFAQIATLSPAELDDEDHPLYPHRARIIRDEWIEQAAEFVAEA